MKILVTNAWKNFANNKQTLEDLGFAFKFVDDNEIIENPSDYDGVICNGLFLKNDISHFTKLKFIQLTSAGLDRIDLDFIESKGINLKNATGVYSKPISEFVLATVLYELKHLHIFLKNQANKSWKKDRDIEELSNKKVLIVGCGSVGTEIAKRFDSFDATVFGCDIVTIDKMYFDKIYHIKDVDTVVSQADIVISCLPLAKDTYHFFGEKIFEKFKHNSIFVNVSRGEVVDTNALIKFLDSNIRKAILDVFEEEPLNAESPLWDNKNIIISPHNSFIGEDNNSRLDELIINNLKKEFGK